MILLILIQWLISNWLSILICMNKNILNNKDNHKSKIVLIVENIYL